MKKLIIGLLLVVKTLSLYSSPIRVGSKNFTESYILAEIISQVIEDSKEVQVERSFGLGGTGISFQALKSGKVDILPEYTGTIAESILKRPELKAIEEIKKELPQNITLSPELGFNNTYAFAVAQSSLDLFKTGSISDLKEREDIRAAFTHEFVKRADGLRSLESHYQFKLQNIKKIEHSLAYQALSSKRVEMIEVYSTDAKIKKYNLALLKDDKSFFPKYLATFLIPKDFKEKYPKTWKSLESRVFGKINEEKMIELNALVELDKKSFSEAALHFLNKKRSLQKEKHLSEQILKLTGEHLLLVLLSLFFSTLIGLPLGILSRRKKTLSRFALGLTGLLQTIPSLALLCFLIPFFGIGTAPAYIALVLYGLLPIVRNTYTGLSEIEPKLLESGELLGLSSFEILKKIEIPLASPFILAGIKTSAIINVGTATLAAFVGAGGLGNLIVTGLALNDHKMILAGALPSALLAILFQFIFIYADKAFIPKALRQLSHQRES